MEKLRDLFSFLKVQDNDPDKPPILLTNLDEIVKKINRGEIKNIITMSGAGISTSAGIPDFRTPGTGLYDCLKDEDLPHAQAVFDIDFFKLNPRPFFRLSKELWPKDKLIPTPTHYFLRLLHEKHLLLRHYTQNIDALELTAGLPEQVVVEAHGSFKSAKCIKCNRTITQQQLKSALFSKSILICKETEGAAAGSAEDCDGIIKPDVVFFGEPLPRRFFEESLMDFPRCDLLIVLGTSLVVHPFASLVTRVGRHVSRISINRTAPPEQLFLDEENSRDIFIKGDCDEICVELVKKLNWKEDFDKLLEERKKILRETDTPSGANL